MEWVILGVTAMICGTVIAHAFIRASHGADVDALDEDVESIARRVEDMDKTSARLRAELDNLKDIVTTNAIQLERVTREKTNSAIAKVLPVGSSGPKS